MGELTLSDKVYGSDGKLHRIIGIFPQGRKKICRVSFTDGTSTLCCDEHLWTVQKDGTDVWMVLEAKQLLKEDLQQHRYKIPITAPIVFKSHYTPQDPYLYGTKLCATTANADDRFGIEEYLYNGVACRTALLQGLMDTAGHIDESGAASFITKDASLKDDFIWLVQSLGGVCSTRKKAGEYRIALALPKEVPPFKLLREGQSFSMAEPTRYITNIKYIGEDECQCIYIDSDEHLYLTNDFIVTHNTEVAVLAMSYLLYRMLCLKDPYAYYGMMPNDKITFSMLNITLDAAQGVGWEKMQQHIQASPWFMTHGSLNASRSNPT